MKTQILSLAAAGILLAGCDTYTAQQYQSSPSNVIALQAVAATGKRASVGSVTAAEGVTTRPTCRLAGPIDIGGGIDVTAAIKQALQAEFLAGNAFSPRGTQVNAVVTELKPDSFSGNWTIGMTVSSSKGQGFNIWTVHKFSTSFSAAAACNNTADAFNRALALSINKIVTDPRFRALL